MASNAREPTGLEIAVIGMAGRFPGAPDLAAFWRNLRDGVESIRRFSSEELAALGVPQARLRSAGLVPAHGAIDGFDRFDAAFFGFTPREASLMDPQQRLLLQTAWQALETAGYDPLACEYPVGVFAGASANQYLHLNLEPRYGGRGSASDFQLRYLNNADFLATRVSYKLDLRGPSATVMTGCSTSLVAVHEACLHLIGGGCEMAIAGGVSVSVPQEWGYEHQEGLIFSPDGHCRPFDVDGRGTLKGDGVGVVVLKRLADAKRDGDPIRAVILGSTVNNDGAGKVGFAAPGLEGQVAAIRGAHEIAEIDPTTIGYLEAHGTGTPLGDPIEIAALSAAFAARTDRRGFCALGSVKANIGHLDAAAGIAGFIKTVLVVENGILPPLVNFSRPNPEIDFATSPVTPNIVTRSWPAGDTPRRAAVSSFGIGGTNAHVVVEQAPDRVPLADEPRPRLLVMSGRSVEAVDDIAGALATSLRAEPAPSLAAVEATLARGRHPWEIRRAVVCRSTAEAADRLADATKRGAIAGTARPGDKTITFLFPGQGAQYVGMGAGLYRGEPVFREAIDRCAALLRAPLGRDLRDLIFATSDLDAASAALTRTRIAQPALFAIEYALARLWISLGLVPAALVGHSVGEWVSACLAEVVSLEDAVELVALRGELMEARPPGAMIAVPLAAEAIRPHLGPDVSIAAINAPSRCVVSGPEEAVAATDRRLAETCGITCTRLQTSHAFHSRMMDPAVAPFVDALRKRKLRPPRIPFVSTVTGTWITEAEACDPAHWARNIHDTVQYAAAVAKILQRPGAVLVECGPGTVLGTLARQQSGSEAEPLVVNSLRHPQKDEDDRETLLAAVGRLWCHDVAVDWLRMPPGAAMQRVALPPYPFRGERYWVDPLPPSATAAGRATDEPAGLLPPEDRFYAPSWIRLQPANGSTPRREAARWFVIGDGDSLDARVASHLAARGDSVVAMTVDPGDAARCGAVLRDALTDDAPIRILWMVATTPPAGAVRQATPPGLQALIAAIKVLAARRLPMAQLIVVASGTQDVTGQEILSPWNALAAGLAVVAPQEIPGLRARLIDIDHADGEAALSRLARLLLDELDATDDEPFVALRAGHRWARRFERIAPPSIPPTAPRTWLVTGGLGKIGSAITQRIAADPGARVIVLGRTALPERAAWPALLAGAANDDPIVERVRLLDAWTRRGLAVEYAAVDIADETALRTALARLRARHGRIDRVVHCAGVAGLSAYRRIAQLDDETCEILLRAKVGGAMTLLRALADDPPETIVLASSLAVILGGPGAGAYAAANAVLDTLAQQISRGGTTRCIALNWDAWSFDARPAGGAAPDHFMTVDEGVASLGVAIALAATPQLVVSAGALAPRIERWVRRAGHPDVPPADSPAMPAATDGTPPDACEATLIEIWRDVLGVDAISTSSNFFELGGDSVMGLQIAARANDAGLRMVAKDLFENQTIAGLARVLASRDTQTAATDSGSAAALGRFALADLAEDEISALTQALADAQEDEP